MQTVTIEQGKPWATCEKAYCIGNPFNCPCGYAEGMCGPNYPMPAIRTSVEIFPTRVCLWIKEYQWRLYQWSQGEDGAFDHNRWQ